ncbi:PF20097 family protein [Phycisphaera mikurensis]|uniref:DUF6487 domain-containing protein n=1 Tax=Phycisphaera mikurensis (strain NBRC 102666 / KCTC 22515 / FYK2301M01) TaxID=1142394 RepID=I0IDZ4_PHYMF|nr:PF20097 family protein [Phycisphaera mikurensis]MBB6441289.1 hypothetical protein [Phycisphaera mikurensis]BAM03482.1 hypothetical protein PSMK_13230 [Phycisphaera mikurensis NBRC 102666]
MSDPHAPADEEEALRCPSCDGWQQAGFVAVSEGLLWLRNAEGPSDFAEAIPGTSAILKANRLPAWRCQRCELVTMRVGRDPRRRRATRKKTRLLETAFHEI